MYPEYRAGDYLISTDPAKLQLEVIHGYLAQESYWAQNIPMVTVVRAVENSLNFGLYTAEKQIGYARIISDLATFAYLCDVFVLPAFRGKGLSKWLMQCILAHPDLQGLRRIMLMTKDAHGLYAPFGFTPMADASKCMEMTRPGIYKKNTRPEPK